MLITFETPAVRKWTSLFLCIKCKYAEQFQNVMISKSSR
jgi:hypothetical protein